MFGALSHLSAGLSRGPQVRPDLVRISADLSRGRRGRRGQTGIQALDHTLGPELMTNGDLSSGTTGFSTAGATIAAVGGELVVTVTGSGWYAFRDMTTVAGKAYRFRLTMRADAANSVAQSTRTNAGNANLQKRVDANGTPFDVDLIVVAQSTSLRIEFGVASLGAVGAVGDKGYFSKISFREMTSEHVFLTSNRPQPWHGMRRYDLKSSCIEGDMAGQYVVDVLTPDTYISTKTYPLVVVLGVEGTPTLFADEMDVIRASNLHNIHDAIFCRVTTRIAPWWGSVNDGTSNYEKLVRDGLVPWMRSKFSIQSGRNGVSLIGYSKGGFGAVSLILRNSAHFGYAAAWDAPLTSTYAAMIGNGAATAYGTSGQYDLFCPGTILAANKASVNDKTRLVITGYNLYQTEVDAFVSLLSGQSVPYVYDSTARLRHDADAGWMPSVMRMLSALW